MASGVVTMTLTALVPLTDVQAAYWRTILMDHQNREGRGCTVCRVPECEKWREARANLAMAGREDWDPLRDR